MRESRLSGSEGGARFYSSLLPLSGSNQMPSRPWRRALCPFFAGNFVGHFCRVAQT